MRTATLLSFLPGIRKLIRDHRRLGAEVARLQADLALSRQENAQPWPGLTGLLPEGSSDNAVAGPPPLTGFCPKPPSYVLSSALGAAYLQIPKAACSSILARVLAAEKPETYAELEPAIRRTNAPLHHTKGLFPRSRAADGLLRFTFVRHPFDRVLSFYQDQIGASQGARESDDLGPMAEELERTGFRLGMPFEEYVARILGNPASRDDHHVRPQSEFVIGVTGLNVDFIGKVEEMGRHWAWLDAALGGKMGQIDRINFSGGKTWRASPHFDRRTVDLLARHYRYDLWLFGYDASAEAGKSSHDSGGAPFLAQGQRPNSGRGP